MAMIVYHAGTRVDLYLKNIRRQLKYDTDVECIIVN